MAPRKSSKSPVPAVEAPPVEVPKPVKGKAKAAPSEASVPAKPPAKAATGKASAATAPKVDVTPVETPAPKGRRKASAAADVQTGTPAVEAPAAPKPRTRKTSSPRSAGVAAALGEPTEAAPVEEESRTEVAPTVKEATKRVRAPRKAEPVEAAPAVALPSESLPPHVATAIAAVRAGRAIELIFQDADANPPRTFEARQVLFDVFTGQWFIWGWDRRYNAERHHRMDQLAEVNVVEGVGRSAQGPYAEGTPANQIGGWRGGESIPVRAVLQKQWVFAVRQAPAPFPDFILVEQEDGRALVSFTATDLRAIARWVMQFGDGITVQEPLRLVDRIKQVAQAWGAKLVAAPSQAPAKAAPVAASSRQTARSESRTEPRAESRSESRPEPRPEPRSESRAERAPRVREHKDTRDQRDAKEGREAETRTRNGRVEIRIDRL